ncbi:MAG: GspE/PulE family protein [Planctomycetota bacterium]
MQKQDPIISCILEENILNEKTLQMVLKQQEVSGESLVNILEENKLVDEEQLTRIIAASNKIEFINLSSDMVQPMAAHMVSAEIVNQHNVIPIKKEGSNLLVAMSEPWDLVVRDQIGIKTGCKVVPVAATPSAIKQAIRYHFNVRNVTSQAIASMRLKQDTEKKKHVKSKDKSILFANDPITKLVSSIVTGAIDAGASDIHIEPQQPDMKVRYRIDGLLHDAIKVPSSAQPEVVSRIKVLAEMDISERRAPQDGHITEERDGHKYDLRVSSLPSVGGEKIVIRILDQSADKWSLNKVATSSDDNQKFRTLATNSYGVLLLTGPTGSGKTTTLYSILQLLNTPQKNIVTVEDPVEYRLEGITQIQVNPRAGMTFASVLRSILRQDPDVILIGEIRDIETAEIAVSAALTGHLVLSTLHTNDATGAISRLITLGVPSFLVTSAILGTAAQRLVRTICPKCKQPYTPSSEERKLLFGSGKKENIQLYRGTGCDYCYNSGYHGRKSIYEILCISPEIRKMITESTDDITIMRQAIKEGMKTLHQSGIEEVLNGTTTLEELQRFIGVE